MVNASTDFLKSIEEIEFNNFRDIVTLTRSDLDKLLKATFSEGAEWQREFQGGTMNAFDSCDLVELVNRKIEDKPLDLQVVV